MNRILKYTCAAILASLLLAGFNAQAGNALNLLPTPKVMKIKGGSMALTAESRIVATEPSLVPLAEILSNEIWLTANLKLIVATDATRAGDIILKINPGLKADADILTVHGQDVVKTREYAHTIDVSERCVIEGWDYRAVCEGTATLLQAITIEGDKITVPKMAIKDWPYSDYSAIMPDCARQHQPIYVLKSAVETCRLFKIRYLHLHLSDDSAFTFPSTAYPEASSVHYPPVTPYTLEELNELVAYADARGVTCVPEIDGPGHCTALMDGMKGKLGDVRLRVIDVLNPEVYPILDTIVGEICDVFKSSPYFHIGGDEVEPAHYLGQAHVKKYMEEHNLTGESSIWLPYGQNMARIVKKHGKKTLMWDGLPVGCPLDASLANEIILYTWFPRKGRAREALDMGYTTITVPWDMPPFPEFSMFTCNNDSLTRDDKVLGHCRPMWEMDHVALALGYLAGSPERHERSWGPDNVIEEGYHKNRMAQQNARAWKIVRPVTFSFDQPIKDGIFNEPITVTMSIVPAGARIHYRLDGQDPTTASPRYEAPFKHDGSLDIRAAVFDEDGNKLGNTALFRARYVHSEASLTTGKPVFTSGSLNPNEKREYTVDGAVDITKYWGTLPAPQWWQVDLEKAYTVDRIQVVPYFDGSRYYQYTVSVGTDTNSLTQVVDASQNTEVGTEKGYLHTFAPTQTRYIRIYMLKNSANPAVHLVEVRAFEAGK